jgi:hypothetical protein
MIKALADIISETPRPLKHMRDVGAGRADGHHQDDGDARPGWPAAHRICASVGFKAGLAHLAEQLDRARTVCASGAGGAARNHGHASHIPGDDDALQRKRRMWMRRYNRPHCLNTQIVHRPFAQMHICIEQKKVASFGVMSWDFISSNSFQ